MQCSAVQCSAVQCSAVQCSAVQCSAVQSSAVQRRYQCESHGTVNTLRHTDTHCTALPLPSPSPPPAQITTRDDENRRELDISGPVDTFQREKQRPRSGVWVRADRSSPILGLRSRSETCLQGRARQFLVYSRPPVSSTEQGGWWGVRGGALGVSPGSPLLALKRVFLNFWAAISHTLQKVGLPFRRRLMSRFAFLRPYVWRRHFVRAANCHHPQIGAV